MTGGYAIEQKWEKEYAAKERECDGRFINAKKIYRFHIYRIERRL